MKRISTRLAALPLSCLLLTAIPAQVQAQDEDDAIEEVVVTGSYIRRTSQFDSPSPIQNVDATQLESIGAKNIADVVQTLTINTGSQNNPDAFTQNSTVGTSNFNLRGLGVASTLVLLNGKRQVLTGLTTNDGLSFVDTSSLVPLIAVDNIEILKDGAAALYGSDAVAGVVNFRTRNDFDGFEFTGDYQFVSDEGDSSEYVLQALFGSQGERSSLVAALSFTERTPLSTAEKRLSRPQDDASVLGNPGSFFLDLPISVQPFVNPVTGAPVPFLDPVACSAVGGLDQIAVPNAGGTGLDLGTCGFDFGDFFNLIPDETRWNGFARGTYELTDSVQLVGEFGFARNRVIRGNSPSFPILTLPTVPANHPNNPLAGSPFGGIDLLFLGREIGNGGSPAPTINELDTWRSAIELNGDLDNGWYWQLGFVGAINESVNFTEDTLAQEFQDALNGFGGSRCSGPTDPSAAPGVGPCQYFNPFASSFFGSPNSQDVIDSFTAFQVLDTRSELTTIDAVVSGELFDMASGPASIAIGAQIRNEELAQDYNSLANQDRFAFVIGNPDFDGDRDVNAAFVELALPISDTFDLQLALRYEDYGGVIGSTTDPKIAGIFRPTDTFTARASFSTSFRAPSLFQVFGGSTSLDQVNDPITGGQFFASVRSSANPDLRPEESDAYNIGISYEPIENLVFDLDFWSFEFTDVIIQENFQAVLESSPQDPSRVIRAGDPLNGPVLQINVGFVNASSVETNGFDFAGRYQWDTSAGIIQPFIEGTFVNKYDLEDPLAGSIDGAGRRNFSNFGTSTPELRFNAGLGWLQGAHSANIFARYISDYDDDQNCADGLAATGGDCDGARGGFKEIDSWLSIDAQYSVDTAILFDREVAPVLTFGVINATGEDPPQVFTNGGFDSRVHDPRGRMFYVRLKQAF
ncbi:MAG: TonB-dependent receptor [Pseudomonadota bacterium]